MEANLMLSYFIIMFFLVVHYALKYKLSLGSSLQYHSVTHSYGPTYKFHPHMRSPLSNAIESKRMEGVFNFTILVNY